MMLSQIRSAFVKAHSTIRGNMVVIWFPALFNTTAAVLVMLAAVILILPVAPELFTGSGLTTIDPALINAVYGRSLVLMLLIAPIIVAANAGAIYMQARAAEGEKVDTGYFLRGIKRIGVKILAGTLIVWAIYGVIFAVTVALFSQGLARILVESGLEAVSSPEALAELLAGAMPSLLATALIFATVSVVFSMWARVLAVREVGVFHAFKVSLGFVVRNFLPLSIILFFTWLITTVTQPMLESVSLGGLIYLVFAYTVRVYMSMALMHYYLEKTGT